MLSASLLRTPELSLRWIPVWRRNLLVWRKLALASVLGNIADPNSRVSQEKLNPRTYGVLEFLLTKPRLTYLARVRNPNPAMPDAQKMPFSTKEYADYMTDGADPLTHGHAATHNEAAHGVTGEPHKAPGEAKRGEH